MSTWWQLVVILVGSAVIGIAIAAILELCAKHHRTPVAPPSPPKFEKVRHMFKDTLWQPWGGEHNIKHRVVVFWDHVAWAAQGVVIDIGSQGASADEAIERYRAALAAEMRVSISPAFLPGELSMYLLDKWTQGEAHPDDPNIRVVPRS